MEFFYGVLVTVVAGVWEAYIAVVGVVFRGVVWAVGRVRGK